MSNFIARIRRALGLVPKQTNEIWTEDQIAGLREFWNRSAKKPPERSLTIEPAFYDLSKPATVYPVNIASELIGLSRRDYLRHRNLKADRALALAARDFAWAVLEALDG